MREVVVILAAFTIVGFLGWARAEWRIKREEFRADVELSYKVADLRQRLIVAEQQLEWYRSRSNHPALRRGSK